MRVPNVNGNDKKFVPDGQLCGGGLAAFKGLNIARDDFPATNVTGGKTLTIKYRTTAAHQGSFRVYITNQGYDPLQEADLGRPGRQAADRRGQPAAQGRLVRVQREAAAAHRAADALHRLADLEHPGQLLLVLRPRVQVRRPGGREDLARRAPSRRAGVAAEARPRHRFPARVALAAPAAATTEPPPAAQGLTPVSNDTKVTLGHEIVIGAIVLAVAALAVGGFGRLRRKRFENR